MVNRENTCLIIVTYNPVSNILNSLIIHIKIFKRIIIIDNGSSNELFTQLASFCNKNKDIEIISLHKNFGIAYALNIGIKRALDLKYKWIISFDQDSIPNYFLFEYYNKVIESYNNSPKIGLIGGGFSFHNNMIKHEVITWEKSLSIITSATLYNSAIFNTVGFFDEKLFIDSVDFEFNLRVRKCKYLTIKIDQPLIQHNLGSPIERKIFNRTIKSTNHNIERRYYFARNHVIITKRYFFVFPLWVIKKNFFFLKSIMQIIFVEQDVRLKLYKILIGIKDGLFLCK